jgi:hypothetical protein
MKYGEDLTRRLTSEVDLDFAKTIREPLSKAIETSAGSGVDFEDGKVVMTESYHIKRGSCCGNQCRHCPYFPAHKKENTTIFINNG